ncbi:MAG: helix-turn-helix domain-containing protein [Desulfurococcaceae archaeon]|nr:helix-turn-helix domain-containing protein [Desulfurococcaceae archaeon]
MKNKNSTWKYMPLHRIILEVVFSRPEGLSESKLEEIVRKEYGVDITKSELYHTLMKLELQGLIQVETIGKEFLIKPVKT